ncbi:HAMP domain-containing sensor histidine kinase [uncultured Duncaniella sp.]|uniref:sensor histidine kinase n=1 Tax=uncultured Duncaniella sp. TaxID=2768039 RepID=UPI0025E0E9EF|nr:sensor histidine kinase [uncultured Duncaniella sp.]
MRRLICAVITMTLATMMAMADSQADFNMFIKAYNQQVASRQYLPAAKSLAKAARICAEAKNYDGAFKLVSGLDKIMAERGVRPDSLPQPYYYNARTRYSLYRRMGNDSQAEAWLKKMAAYAKECDNAAITNDMLFTEAQFYYAMDRTQLGDRCIARLIKQYESDKDYKAADTAYQKLISRAVSSNDARLVGHTYESYIRWSDSIEAINTDTEIGKVKQEMAQSEAEVAKKQSTINSRTSLMIVFITLFVIAVAALGLGAVFYQRIRAKNRHIRRMKEEADMRSAAKSAMLQNMSSTMEPALDRLNPEDPAVQTLKGYVRKVEELSAVDSSPAVDPSGLENVNIETLAAELAAETRPKLRKGVTLHLDGTRGFVKMDRADVTKILTHLLDNAARYTPEGGRITLAYRKRGANSHQFVVTDSGPGIPASEREGLFKAFSSAHDINDGDRLGLPICALRAEKMGGTLTIDPEVTKGSSFILSIKSA